MWVGTQEGLIFFFENVGNATTPRFEQRLGNLNPMNGVDVGYSASPALVDQDNGKFVILN